MRGWHRSTWAGGLMRGGDEWVSVKVGREFLSSPGVDGSKRARNVGIQILPSPPPTNQPKTQPTSEHGRRATPCKRGGRLPSESGGTGNFPQLAGERGNSPSGLGRGATPHSWRANTGNSPLIDYLPGHESFGERIYISGKEIRVPYRLVSLTLPASAGPPATRVL